jgi:hypothetical protein
VQRVSACVRVWSQDEAICIVTVLPSETPTLGHAALRQPPLIYCHKSHKLHASIELLACDADGWLRWLLRASAQWLCGVLAVQCIAKR